MLNDTKKSEPPLREKYLILQTITEKQRGQELRNNPVFLRNNPRLLDDNLGLLLHPDRLREIVAEILAARGQLMMYQIRQDLLQLELLHVTVSRIALDGLYEISELGLTNARNAYQMAHLTT